MDYIFAHRMARELQELLRPACRRIEIAGSIRRRKPEGIHDIELVCIPRPAQLALGGAPVVSQLHDLTDRLRGLDQLTPRRDASGRIAWGLKYRRAEWQGAAVDLFITTPEQWGVIFTLRTGDSDFSRCLVTPQPAGVMPLGMRIEQGHVWRDIRALDTPEERDVFIALNLPWIEPEQRTSLALRRAVRAQARHSHPKGDDHER